MHKSNMGIPKEVKVLLDYACNPAPLKKCYFFEGDLCQMTKAYQVAQKLGKNVEIAGGVPYVKSKEDFDEVVNYIRVNQIEGYWHYKK